MHLRFHVKRFGTSGLIHSDPFVRAHHFLDQNRGKGSGVADNAEMARKHASNAKRSISNYMFDTALREIDKAIKYAPELKTELHRYLANAYASNAKRSISNYMFDTALREIDKAIKYAPDLSDGLYSDLLNARFARARQDIEFGSFSSAESELDAALAYLSRISEKKRAGFQAEAAELLKDIRKGVNKKSDERMYQESHKHYGSAGGQHRPETHHKVAKLDLEPLRACGFDMKVAHRVVNAKTPEEALGLPHGCGEKEIKSAYRKLVRIFSPDLNGDKHADVQKILTNIMQILNSAKDTLLNPKNKSA